MIYNTLCRFPGKKFSATQLAMIIYALYPEEFVGLTGANKSKDLRDVINRLSSQISTIRDQVVEMDTNVKCDYVSPRRIKIWYEEALEEINSFEEVEDNSTLSENDKELKIEKEPLLKRIFDFRGWIFY